MASRDERKVPQRARGHIAALTHLLLEDGAVPPIYVGVVGANGYVAWFVYTVGRDGSLQEGVIGVREVGATVDLPVNILFVDSQGNGARGVIRRGAPPSFQLFD